jgi:hypothetical protein
MLDNQNIEHSGSLSKSYKELEKLKEINEILVSGKRPEARDFLFKDRRKAIG